MVDYIYFCNQPRPSLPDRKGGAENVLLPRAPNPTKTSAKLNKRGHTGSPDWPRIYCNGNHPFTTSNPGITTKKQHLLFSNPPVSAIILHPTFHPSLILDDPTNRTRVGYYLYSRIIPAPFDSTLSQISERNMCVQV